MGGRAFHAARPPPPAAIQTSEARAINKMDAAAARGDVVAAAEYFFRLRGTHLSKSSFLWNLMLKAYACAGDYKGAEAHLLQMHSYQVSPTHRTFGKIIKAAAKGGLTAESEEVWRRFLQNLKMHPAPLKDEDFQMKVNMLVDAAGNAGDVEQARYWLHQLGCMANCRSYAGLLKAFAKQSLATEAVSCLQEMGAKRLCPDSVCFVLAITACGRSGDVTGALHLLDQMHGSNTPHSSADRDAANTSVLNAYAKSSNVPGAEQWLLESRITPTLQMYHTLLDAVVRAGLPERAENLFRRMLEAGHEPTAESAGALIRAVLSGQTSQSGIQSKLQSQLEFLCGLNRKLEKSSPVHLAMLDAFSQSAIWTSALKQLDNMQADGCVPCLPAYTSAITACGRASQLHKMKYLFDAISDQQLRRDEVVYGSCIHAAVRFFGCFRVSFT